MNIETPDHCFGSPNWDIDGPMKDAGITMLTDKFDAFGEAVPDALCSTREAPSSASRIVGRIGRCVFWLLVVAIVFARITYYPASSYPAIPAFEVSGVTNPGHALRH
jgi:hypothetical protein